MKSLTELFGTNIDSVLCAAAVALVYSELGHPMCSEVLAVKLGVSVENIGTCKDAIKGYHGPSALSDMFTILPVNYYVVSLYIAPSHCI